MKVLKVIVIILVIIFAGYSIWMATLPKEYTMERSTVVDAPPSVVFAEVNDLRSWPQWSPWSKMDSTQTMEYSDPASGEGAYYTWEGDITKSGKYIQSEVMEDESINYDMDFAGMHADGYWKFAPIDDETKVTWAYHAEFGFFDRWSKYVIENTLGHQFQQGLEDLKQVVESKPRKPAIEVAMVDNLSTPYFAITDEVGIKDLDQNFFADRYEEIHAYLGEDAQNISGAPFAIYEKWDEENELAIVAVALPVNSDMTGNDRVKKGTTYQGKALKAVYVGPYEGSGEAHYAIDDYIKANDMEIAGFPWEVYVTGPSTEPDSTKWVTEIYYPVSTGDDKNI